VNPSLLVFFVLRQLCASCFHVYLRKQEILDAAQRCFVANGFHRSTMAEIANLSGLSMGLLYRYFRNKEKIVMAVAAQDREELMVGIAAFADAPTALHASTLWIKRALQLGSDPAYAALACEIVAESSRHAELAARLKSDQQQIREAMQSAVKKQQVAGNVSRNVDALAAAELLLMVMDGAIGRGVLLGAVAKPALQAKLVGLVHNALVAV
jgi:TetR/AcrR family transcriptional regulator, repressor for uid operon